jgi:glycosyltransferase involved in cell wall biosynthesis
VSGDSAADMKRIVHLSTVHPALEQRLFFKEALTASTFGHEVVVIAPHHQAEIVQGVRIIPIREWRSRILRGTFAAARAFAIARRQRADLYHFHDPELLPWSCLLQAVTKRPVVFDMREYHVEAIRAKQWIPRLLRLPIAWLYNRVETTLLRRLSGVVTVNDELAERVRRKGGRALVAPNYAPRGIFEDPVVDEGLRVKYENQDVLVYVGGLSEERGISKAIEVAARLRQEFPRVTLLLVGGVHYSGYRRTIQRLISDLGVEAHVELVGQVPHPDVPKLLGVADVALFLLQPVNVRYDNTEPIKYFEYSAAGLPLVVSDLPAMRRLVERIGNGVVVNPADTEEIANAVASLLRDARLRQEMGARGRKAFLDTYNWEAIGMKLLNWYAEVGGWHDGEHTDSGATRG